MDWARILAYVTGTVDQELLARNEYLAAENRILKAKLKERARRVYVRFWRRPDMHRRLALTVCAAFDPNRSFNDTRRRDEPPREALCSALNFDRAIVVYIPHPM